MRHAHMLPVVTGGLVLIAACGGTTAPEEGPPALPPDVSFVVPFDDFQNSPLSASPASEAGALPGANWAGAALTVAVWNTIITVTLAAPVASFVAAVNETPTWESDHWEWRYDFSVLNQQYSARLLAAVDLEGVNWSMFISGPDFDDFNWYNGTSELDGSSGFWRLQLSPQDRTPFMDIQWSRDAVTGVGSIRYTNAILGSTEQGGHISFTNQVVEDNDRWYQVFSASASATTDIQWNSVTKAGRINGPQSDGSVEWRCWDVNLDDVACIS